MKKFLPLGVVLLALIGVGYFAWQTFLPESRDFVALVSEIVEVSQTYDGEHVERLAGLGPQAVPAIGEALAAPDQFPMRYVYALERIGSAEGAAPILMFLSSQSPFSDDDESYLSAATIRALKDLGSRSVCGPVGEILESSSSHPRVRLAAAEVIARSCAENDVANAQNIVLEYYENRVQYLVNANRGFMERELYEALISIDSGETQSILLDTLDNRASDQVAEVTISHLATKDGVDVGDSLLGVLQDPEWYQLPIRLKAATALFDSGVPDIIAREQIQQLLDEARTDGWDATTIEAAEELLSQSND